MGPFHPLLLYDGSTYSAEQKTLTEAMGGFSDNLDFDGRCVIAKLTCLTSPNLTFLAVAYHGRHHDFGGKAAKECDIDDVGSDSKRVREAVRFIECMGKAAARLGLPAVIGGDWNAKLMNYNGLIMPAEVTWMPHLRYVERFEPSGLACSRYGIPGIDYFCCIEPTQVSRKYSMSTCASKF